MEFHKDLTMRVEGCILLIGLLYGNCRNSVIQKVRNARLVPKINDSFSFFFNPANGPLVADDSQAVTGEDAAAAGESIVQSLRIQVNKKAASFVLKKCGCFLKENSELPQG